MFSHRVPQDLTPTAWARARAARGEVRYDLTVSNPTRCGLPYPHDLLAPLGVSGALSYRPNPKGLRSAREAISREYAASGVRVDPEQIVLTASSSESYTFLFKRMCDAGDAVLVPTPSYPLFAHLAELENVRAVPFLLDPTGDWQPVPPERSVAIEARAAIVVHPNNPTGSWVDPGSAERLVADAGRGPVPLIVDEVFLDYPFAPHPHATSFAARSSGLTFTLGGLSKSRGLPQLKLSWIVTSGPPADVAAALAGLEFIADSYLSVSTPIQLALPELLDRAAPVRDAIRARCAVNLACARRAADDVPGVEVLPPGGGWSVVLRFPHLVSEDVLALELLDRHDVAVHPGYFFDFSTEGYLVLSLLPPAETFERGLRLVLDAIASRL